LPDPAPARFALVTRYASLRALPTDLTALKTPGDLPFDRLQETTVDVGWPVAVLHTTADGAWAFGLTPGYWGWIKTRNLAFAPREQVQAFVTADPALMVQASWGGVALPGEAHHRALQMGTSLPLVGEKDGLYRVQVPRTDAAGNLALIAGYVSTSDPGWRVGLLPATLRTVITQAFKPLGEPYGWGGMCLGRPGRDCSRLVWDAWASAGVFLPRNSGDQGAVGHTVARFAPDEPHASRLRWLAEDVPPGALLMLPGHVMLYLGTVNAVPYALHALWGYVHPAGNTTRAAQVVVSALPPEPGAGEPTLLERLTHVQVIAPE
ncbi:MAG: SH3 domain-containing protein, partial [Anaerolineae bacterium]|nr:SH3 domain-containing protein [Anaerolineae bacterium]